MVLLVVAFITIATVALAAKVVYPQMLDDRQQQSLTARNEWEHVAKLFGLRFRRGRTLADHELSGTIEGFPVRISSTDTTTRYSVQLPKIDAPTMVMRQRRLSARALDDPLRYLRNKNDIPEPFEQAVEVTAEDADAVQRYLTPARKSELVELFETVREALVTDTHVEAEIVNFDWPRATTMIETTSALIKAATEMSPPQDRQLESPQDRQLTSSATSILASQSNLPTDLRSLLDDLYDSSRNGFEIDEHFAEHYTGRSVEWSGVIDTVRDFRHDSDFGSNGRKVIVNLGNDEGTAAVLSVDQAIDVLQGQTLEFIGTMMRFDRVANQIYIRDGALSQRS